MNYKEYRIQKALGSIDYLVAARTTKSPKVLEDIYKRLCFLVETIDSTIKCSDYNDVLTISLAIVSNINISIETLKKILLNLNMDVIETGVHNPKVTRALLEEWIKTSYFLSSNVHVRKHLYNLQAIDNIPEKDRIEINTSATISTPNYPYYPWPPQQPEPVKQGEYKTWTTTDYYNIEWIKPSTSNILPYIVTS